MRGFGSGRGSRLGRTLTAGTVALGVMLGITGGAAAGHAPQRHPAAAPTVRLGATAPNAAFIRWRLEPGQDPGTTTLRALAGHPLLLWLVTTWCPTCLESTRVLARHWSALQAAGVRVVELELYRDMGVRGPALSTFAAAARPQALRPQWIWGLASRRLSLTYDPHGLPDVYYLIGPHQHIRFINEAPVATMPALLRAAAALAARHPVRPVAAAPLRSSLPTAPSGPVGSLTSCC
jgi:hypothetical protein